MPGLIRQFESEASSCASPPSTREARPESVLPPSESTGALSGSELESLLLASQLDCEPYNSA